MSLLYFGGTTAPSTGEEAPPQSFRLQWAPTAVSGTTTINTSRLLMGWRATEWIKDKKEWEKGKQNISSPLCARKPLFLSSNQNWKATSRALSVHVDAHSQFLCCTDFRPVNIREGKWVSTPWIWWCFNFWFSFPTHLLLLIFQSPQIADPCSLSKLYSYIQWEIVLTVLLLSVFLMFWHLGPHWLGRNCFSQD